LTFGSIKKDRIFINILTDNNYLKGTISSVNGYIIKWVCNKKLSQFEYIKTNLKRKNEDHKNKVTKCNKNQSKGENKAPKIINTGKYTTSQLVYITYQQTPQRVTIGIYTINKPVIIINQEDPQRIISNKGNSLTIMIIKSINITYLFFKPINQDES
jgi:hypothetical protein